MLQWRGLPGSQIRIRRGDRASMCTGRREFDDGPVADQATLSTAPDAIPPPSDTNPNEIDQLDQSSYLRGSTPETRMKPANIYDAKTRLSPLADRTAAGEGI